MEDGVVKTVFWALWQGDPQLDPKREHVSPHMKCREWCELEEPSQKPQRLQLSGCSLMHLGFPPSWDHKDTQWVLPDPTATLSSALSVCTHRSCVCTQMVPVKQSSLEQVGTKGCDGHGLLGRGPKRRGREWGEGRFGAEAKSLHRGQEPCLCPSSLGGLAEPLVSLSPG